MSPTRLCHNFVTTFRLQRPEAARSRWHLDGRRHPSPAKFQTFSHAQVASISMAALVSMRYGVGINHALNETHAGSRLLEFLQQVLHRHGTAYTTFDFVYCSAGCNKLFAIASTKMDSGLGLPTLTPRTGKDH